MNSSATFVIAEIGVNHNGSVDIALDLVDQVARAGADAAKFQTFTADGVASPKAGTVAYQKSFGGDDQREMLRRLELSYEAHEVLVRRCSELGVEFMSTAFDLASLDMLCSLGIRRIKIPSGEITNLPYVVACALKKLPIILSTGMSDLTEVRNAFELIVATWHECGGPAWRPGDENLTILHCTSAYPTAPTDVNLRAMVGMQADLGTAIGFSDHTAGILAPALAVALGAKVVEKHVTLDRGMDGPDHAASIEPDQLRQMIKDIRTTEAMLGQRTKRATVAEEEARLMVRRGLKAGRALAAGSVLTEADISILRPATGVAPGRMGEVVGRRLLVPLAHGDAIEFEHLG
jgi:N,N'-diacetyllegionaminate synthase